MKKDEKNNKTEGKTRRFENDSGLRLYREQLEPPGFLFENTVHKKARTTTVDTLTFLHILSARKHLINIISQHGSKSYSIGGGNFSPISKASDIHDGVWEIYFTIRSPYTSTGRLLGLTGRIDTVWWAAVQALYVWLVWQTVCEGVGLGQHVGWAHVWDDYFVKATSVVSIFELPSKSEASTSLDDLWQCLCTWELEFERKMRCGYACCLASISKSLQRSKGMDGFFQYTSVTHNTRVIVQKCQSRGAHRHVESLASHQRVGTDQTASVGALIERLICSLTVQSWVFNSPFFSPVCWAFFPFSFFLFLYSWISSFFPA